MNENHDFILFDSQMACVDLMTDEQAGQLLKAMYHHNHGLEVEFQDAMVQMAFMMFWQAVENSRAKRAKMRENGSKGGIAKRDNQQEADNDVANSSKSVADTSNGIANPSEKKQEVGNGVANSSPLIDIDIDMGLNIPPSPKGVPPKAEEKGTKETIATVLKEQPAELIPALKEFVEHRKQIRKSLTPHALRLLICDLQQLAPGNIERQHYLIDYAIKRGWQGFFEPKENQQRQGYLTEAERRQAHNDAVCRQVAAELEAADSPF